MVQFVVTGGFCVRMLIGFPQAFTQTGQQRRAIMRNNSAQCEMLYDEMSQLAYELVQE